MEGKEVYLVESSNETFELIKNWTFYDDFYSLKVSSRNAIKKSYESDMMTSWTCGTISIYGDFVVHPILVKNVWLSSFRTVPFKARSTSLPSDFLSRIWDNHVNINITFCALIMPKDTGEKPESLDSWKDLLISNEIARKPKFTGIFKLQTFTLIRVPGLSEAIKYVNLVALHVTNGGQLSDLDKYLGTSSLSLKVDDRIGYTSKLSFDRIFDYVQLSKVTSYKEVYGLREYRSRSGYRIYVPFVDAYLQVLMVTFTKFVNHIEHQQCFYYESGSGWAIGEHKGFSEKEIDEQDDDYIGRSKSSIKRDILKSLLLNYNETTNLLYSLKGE